MLESDNYEKHPRGLSKTKICIVVAIDSSKNMLAIICGHGKPSSKRVYAALKDHIRPGYNNNNMMEIIRINILLMHSV
mgnify:CR=1 FL=1